MPRFFRDMPENKEGVYYASAYAVYLSENNIVYETPKIKCTSVRKAYFKARWEAFKLDLNSQFANREIGIHWKVTDYL